MHMHLLSNGRTTHKPNNPRLQLGAAKDKSASSAGRKLEVEGTIMLAVVEEPEEDRGKGAWVKTLLGFTASW